MNPASPAFWMASRASRSGSVYTEDWYSGGTSGELRPRGGGVGMTRPSRFETLGPPPATAEPLDQAGPPGPDRLAGQEAVEVVGQGQGAGVAVPRVAFQALAGDGLQVAGQP